MCYSAVTGLRRVPDGARIFFSFRYQFSNVSELSQGHSPSRQLRFLLRLIRRRSVGTTRQAAVGLEVVKVRMNRPRRSETRVLIDLDPQPDSFQILDQEILVGCRGRRSTSARTNSLYASYQDAGRDKQYINYEVGIVRAKLRHLPESLVRSLAGKDDRRIHMRTQSCCTTYHLVC